MSDRASATGAHEAAAAAFVERADELDGVDELHVFGSVARGDPDEGSDVDVLAVLARDAEYAVVDDELLDIAYDVGLQYGVPVEVHSIRAGEFAAREERGDPFVRAVIEAGEAGA